jgi:glucosamine 6-phosphate synthetase-like amidotransferase/phosphosugar isomerase protein
MSSRSPATACRSTVSTENRSSASARERAVSDAVERGEYRHYMQKEIFEQPRAVADTLEARIGPNGVLPNIFGIDSDALLQRT